jgi:hypothetical protein
LSAGGNHWLTAWTKYRQSIAETQGIDVSKVKMPVGLDMQQCFVYINLTPSLAKHVASTHNEVLITNQLLVCFVMLA